MKPDEVEDSILVDVVRSARVVQEFLWGKADGSWGIEEWRRMFRKRVAKIEEINESNPHALIELKKRVLQQAALSLAFLGILERNGMITWKDPGDLPSNLSQYAEPILEKITEK